MTISTGHSIARAEADSIWRQHSTRQYTAAHKQFRMSHSGVHKISTGHIAPYTRSVPDIAKGSRPGTHIDRSQHT
eukprot:3464407-Rhodomonas_salina.5